MDRAQLVSLQNDIKACSACGDGCETLRVTSPRGKLSADVLMVISSPTEEEASRGFPLSNECAKYFHEILLRYAKFNTEQDALITCLTMCVQKKRDRNSTVSVRNCAPLFNRLLLLPQIKLIAALGYDVARNMFGQGSNVPRTLVGNHMTMTFPFYQGLVLKKKPVEVFVFDDPQLIQEDLDALDWNGKPRTETRVQDRLAKQAKAFADLRRRVSGNV